MATKAKITNIKTKLDAAQTSKNAHGYIDHLSGLWVIGWLAHDKEKGLEDPVYNDCELHVNGELVLKFSAIEKRQDLENLLEYRHGRAFNLQFPAQKLAKTLIGAQNIEISIFTHGENIGYSKVVPIDDYYRGLFDSLSNEVNSYLSYLPLFTKESLQYLSEWQVAYLLDVLMKTRLAKVKMDIFSELCVRLSCKNDEEGFLRDLILSLCYQDDFLSIFFSVIGDKVASHSIYDIVHAVLATKSHMFVNELIEKSIKDDKSKTELKKLYVEQDNKKYDFIENFPKEILSGVSLWDELNEADQREYWPLLAGTLQFTNRYDDLKYLNFKLSWFVGPGVITQEFDELVRQAMDSPENSWFALSFVVYSLVSGHEDSLISDLVKRYAWKSWHISYFDTDTFCEIINRLIKKGDDLDPLVYEDICIALDNVIRFKAEKKPMQLGRKSFIETTADVINLGIQRHFDSFYKVEKCVRNVYALNDIFCNRLDISSLKYFDYNFYVWLNNFYEKSTFIRNFFISFDYTKNYSDVELSKVIYALFELEKDLDIEDIPRYFLFVSRYCQLFERRSLYPLLKTFHLKLDDNHSALLLENNLQEAERLIKVITESGENQKRDDTYWFELALDSRLDVSLEKNKIFIDELTTFIARASKANIFINQDLIHLAISEMIWRLLKSGSVEFGNPLAEMSIRESGGDAYIVLKLVAVTLSFSQKEDESLSLVDEIIKEAGDASQLMRVLDGLGLAISRLAEDIAEGNVFELIKQRFVFPYLCVFIYSCNKYENSRHKILRDTWVKDLDALGIDYKVVVGSAEYSHIDGDMMRLAVEDTYEALPAKSVEMFSFAYRSLMHQYFYKIDDDCILNVKAMFSDPAFLNHAYFGRTVNRPLGGIDRSWHHEKSSSTEAREALDLSPEMSHYCEGSTGYILNRYAVERLMEVANAPANVQLICSSYFEDKMIGDLLAAADIRGVNNGYNCVIRRRVAAGRDVQIWKYGMLPNRKTNVKVVHTESDVFRESYYGNFDRKTASLPKLIYRDPCINMEPEFISDTEQKPLLEIISIDKEAIKKAEVLAIIVCKDEQLFLPGLLEHHRSLGVDHFLFVDNASSDTSIKFMSAQEDVSVFVATQDYKFSRFGVNWQETLLGHYCLGKWALIIDSDELFVFDGFEYKSIKDLVGRANEKGADAIFSPMIDFYPRSDLSQADICNGDVFYKVCNYFDSLESMNILEDSRYGPFSNSKIYSAGLRERIFGRYNPFPEPNYLNQKYNFIKYRPGMKLIEGLHFMSGYRLFDVQCGIMHFKYHSKFHDKVKREVKAEQHWNGAKEYVRYLNLIEGNPSFTLFDKKVSTKYASSEDLVNTGYISKIKW